MDKSKPVDYAQERKAEALIAEGVKAATKMVKERSNGKSGGGSSSGGSNSGAGSSGGGGAKKGKGSAVVELTEENFSELVMNSQVC